MDGIRRNMEDLIVLYEDNHVIVVVKPQNVPSQADISGDLDMLTMVKNYIGEKYNKTGNVFIGLVHRLDRPTGGVMVFARTSKAAARLSEQIKNGELEKKYLTVVNNKLRDKRGRLVNYLVKDEENNIVKVVPAAIEGAKKAVLDYVTLESSVNASLVDVKLLTGRGHQIRAQMSANGCPILGDSKYGDTHKCRLALWSYSLKFLHPTTKQIMTFKVFPPETLPWKEFAIEKYINVVKPE